MPFRLELVGTTVRQVVLYNPKRKTVSLENTGDYDIYIRDQPTEVKEKGWRLTPGRYVTFAEVDGDDPRLALWAVADAENQPLRIYEGFGVVE
jgi:hypothetical protein